MSRRPIDVPTQHTVDFLASRIAPGAKILEIGCGEGHVARRLIDQGCRVVAIDSDPDAVARARERGVDALEASWPHFDAPQVDAVVFSRSLHHLEELQPSVDRARAVLAPGGWLLVEDFAFQEADRITVSWFLGLLDRTPVREAILAIEGELVTELRAAKDPMEVWGRSHDEGLPTIEVMTAAVQKRFDIRETSSAPYLYRYLVAVLPDTAQAAAWVEAVQEQERRAAREGRIVAIGRRIVAA